jgi:regulatory protein
MSFSEREGRGRRGQSRGGYGGRGPARSRYRSGNDAEPADATGPTGAGGLGDPTGPGRPGNPVGPGGPGEQAGPQAPADPVAKAKEICLRLLTARPRTRAELHQALLRKGVEAEVADTVLARFDEVGLVDDAAFAEQWVRSRHTYQGMARRALAAELRRKGVADPLVAEAVTAVDSEAEEERARELVRRKLRTTAPADELTRIRRLVGMLARKGYPEGVAYRVVREELRDAGSETDLLDTALPD